MGQSHKRSGATVADPGRISAPIRPKTLQKRLAPVRQDARAIVSNLYGASVARHSNHARVAAVLCVSESISRRWADPDEPQQVDVADVVALFVASQKTLVYGFLHDVLAWCDAHDDARRFSRTDHAMALSAAVGALAQAAQDGDAAKYALALDDIQHGARDARRDEGSRR